MMKITNKKQFLVPLVIALVAILGLVMVASLDKDYNEDDGFFVEELEMTGRPLHITKYPDEWDIYENDEYGFEFEYPTNFESPYVSWATEPEVVIEVGKSNIDHDGCFVYAEKKNGEIEYHGDMRFCVTQYDDPGAGQIYRSYYYTTENDGTYFTLKYAIHIPNGCGAYDSSSDCLDFFENYFEIVQGPISDSVDSLFFRDPIDLYQERIFKSNHYGYIFDWSSDWDLVEESEENGTYVTSVFYDYPAQDRDAVVTVHDGDMENFLIKYYNGNSISKVDINGLQWVRLIISREDDLFVYATEYKGKTYVVEAGEDIGESIVETLEFIN